MTAGPPSPTLDVLFRRTAMRQPDALALVDPPDKLRVTGQPPLRLTYAEADRAITAIAAHFSAAGLSANAVIAVQLPLCVEFALAVLAAHRAGLVVALLPQLWRQADVTVALNRVGARAIVTAGKIDGVNHAQLAMDAAVEAFSIRHVCGFGSDLPDGMASLDVAMRAEVPTPRAAAQDSQRVAIVTFDVTTQGFRAVPRTHAGLVAGALVTSLESGIPQGATILTAIAPGSVAGLTASVVLWLLSGGTLAFHHPFNADVFERQIAQTKCDVLCVPAGLALRLAESGVVGRSSIGTVLALWRAPEQVASSAHWVGGKASLTDLYLFGEAGIIAARRGDDGLSAALMPGPYSAPRASSGMPAAGEAFITPNGTLGLRGPMVPVSAYASDPVQIQPPFAEIARDHVDTEYAARIDRSSGALCITSPPSGMVAVGGYRFLSPSLQEWAARLDRGALLTALPDRLSGHRLAGRARDNAAARDALAGLGLNPLLVEAFRDQHGFADPGRVRPSAE